jgi:dihydrodipicolinate synthase/N-acetylneuraminate lyase
MRLRDHLLAGQVIPAHPLALTAQRALDERRQRALTRYYVAAGAGGIAVGVHTTQFEIRDPRHALHRPVLALEAESATEALGAASERSFVRVAGVVGRTRQAVSEAEVARDLGYHAALLSLSAWREADTETLLTHCRAVADVIPLFGFYLQPAVGGRVLSYEFWRRFAEIPEVVAIKIAPFNRYQTLDVVRAVAASGRRDIALYTGNDDAIITDLLTPFPVAPADGAPRRIVGGLLGQWAVWTKRAVEMLRDIRAAEAAPVAGASPAGATPDGWLRRAAMLTEANGAIFDARNNFAGCIAGIHEVLRRQGLLAGTWCLDPAQDLSPGQSAEIDRVLAAWPELTDDEFVRENLDEWMR